MEAQELFRRLGAGARFDVQRFGRDARRFGVRSYREEAGRDPRRLSGNLDFFGRKEGAPRGSAGKQEDGAGEKDVEMAGKRKRTAESGKRKRKKIQGIYVYVYTIEYPDKVHSSCFSLH
uniref:Uncharacterized protein n=1 Tax=Pavo cristatus TaxID=9049 RepID=A0A8C9FA84_PAVCR